MPSSFHTAAAAADNATPPRATHRHGTVTNLGGTTTRRHPRRTPAAAQPPPPPPPRGRLEGFALPCKSDVFEPETSCTSKQVLSSALAGPNRDKSLHFLMSTQYKILPGRLSRSRANRVLSRRQLQLTSVLTSTSVDVSIEFVAKGAS